MYTFKHTGINIVVAANLHAEYLLALNTPTYQLNDSLNL